MCRMLTALEGTLQPLQRHWNTASTMCCPKAKDFKDHDDTVMPYLYSRRKNIIPWAMEKANIFHWSTIENGLFKNASKKIEYLNDSKGGSFVSNDRQNDIFNGGFKASIHTRTHGDEMHLLSPSSSL